MKQVGTATQTDVTQGWTLMFPLFSVVIDSKPSFSPGPSDGGSIIPTFFCKLDTLCNILPLVNMFVFLYPSDQFVLDLRREMHILDNCALLLFTLRADNLVTRIRIHHHFADLVIFIHVLRLGVRLELQQTIWASSVVPDAVVNSFGEFVTCSVSQLPPHVFKKCRDEIYQVLARYEEMAQPEPAGQGAGTCAAPAVSRATSAPAVAAAPLATSVGGQCPAPPSAGKYGSWQPPPQVWGQAATQFSGPLDPNNSQAVWNSMDPQSIMSAFPNYYPQLGPRSACSATMDASPSASLTSLLGTLTEQDRVGSNLSTPKDPASVGSNPGPPPLSQRPPPMAEAVTRSAEGGEVDLTSVAEACGIPTSITE